MIIVRDGSVAERSKALVLGTSLLGGVGSNPTAANLFCISFKTVYQLHCEKIATERSKYMECRSFLVYKVDLLDFELIKSEH